MPCYHPLRAYFSGKLTEAGKREIVFNPVGTVFGSSIPVVLPCGRCIGCRLERSRQWAIRCVHEAALHEQNCFITLTFNDRFVGSGSLVKSNFVKFMKRLRKQFGSGIRYFHCGEYGSDNMRPHHHACLFNFDFPDRVLWRIKGGVRLYRSHMLERLWSDPVSGECYGFCTVGDVTFESAAYVARYIMKKITGAMAVDHYGGKVPEYVTMSRRPGLGKGWIEKFESDVFPSDFVVVRGVRCKVPKYYNSFELLKNPELYDSILDDRKVRARDDPDNAPDRLLVREAVQKSSFTRLVRKLSDF